jgi:OOP family OmpA-OmpF porin
LKKGTLLIFLIAGYGFGFAQDSIVVKPKKGGPRYSRREHTGEVSRNEGEVILYGKIINIRNRMPVNAGVDIFRNSDFIDVQGASVANGEFMAPLLDYGWYLISISAPGYITTTDTVWVLNNRRKIIQKSFDIIPVEAGVTVQLSDIHFQFGKAELSAASYHELDKTVKFLKDNRRTRFEIAGHTDRNGPPETNLRLSEDRAQAVVDYLVTHGADPAQLIARGYGDTAPLSTEATPEAEARNRRVELIVLNVGEQGEEK